MAAPGTGRTGTLPLVECRISPPQPCRVVCATRPLPGDRGSADRPWRDRL